MKITLHNPPEGYEAEAEIRKPNKGDKFLDWDMRLDTALRDFQVDRHIVLAPKKRKYWRLDQVEKQEEATRSGSLYLGFYLGILGWGKGEGDCKCLKLTECEEQW